MKGSAFLLALGLVLASSAFAHTEEKAAVAPTTTDAKETLCKNGNMVRRVKAGPVEGSQTECRVSYLKETEEPGTTEKVLWNANNSPEFCQEKAQGFIEKLKGMGWSCE